MMSADAETDLPIDFEPSTRCQESEAWGSERVGRREDDSAVVDAGGEGGVGGTADGEVPVEQVCIGSWGSLIVWRWGVGEFGCFAGWES